MCTPEFRGVFRGLTVGLALWACALGGCALGSVAPGYVKCSGKGVITGSGTVGAGVGGGNTFVLNVDCGDGVTFEQGPALPAVK